MKILLIRYHDRENINSREIKNVAGQMGIWPPLGLIYIGTLLKKHGYQVELLDVLQKGWDSAQAKQRIMDAQADLVGITATTPEIRGVREAARFAKESGARVVIGGPHLGIFPEETVSFPEVDFAIRGDGEIPFLRLVRALENSDKDLAHIPGLVYRQGNGVRMNGVYVEKQLDDLPFPDWGLVNIHGYRRADALWPLATMVSVRGCPYHCGFCYRGAEAQVVRFRNPKSVVDEMEYLIKNWKVREIIFCNDTLTLRREQILDICQDILRRKIKILWQGSTRVDAVDWELLKTMKRAGCKGLKFGVESGSEKILTLMQKGITKEKIRHAFQWCRQAGIRTGAYFILGYAQEDRDTLQETIDFAKALNPDFAMFYAGIPLPQTDFHDLAVAQKKIDPHYWREFALGRRSDRMPDMVPDMDRWIKRAFRQFYGRPGFILKKIFSLDLWLSIIKNPKLLKGLFFAGKLSKK